MTSDVDVVPEYLPGSVLISIERTRQVKSEGWSPDHDDEHDLSELAAAAQCYAWAAALCVAWTKEGHEDGPDILLSSAPSGWPWDQSWWKPSTDPVKNLVKAGALIAAEIDRINRARLTGG